MAEYGLFQPPLKGGVTADQSPCGNQGLVDGSTEPPLFATRNDRCPTSDAAPERLDSLLNEFLCLAQSSGVQYDRERHDNLKNSILAIIQNGEGGVLQRLTALENRNPIVSISEPDANGSVTVTFLDGSTETRDFDTVTATVNFDGTVDVLVDGVPIVQNIDTGPHTVDTDTTLSVRIEIDGSTSILDPLGNVIANIPLSSAATAANITVTAPAGQTFSDLQSFLDYLDSAVASIASQSPFVVQQW